MEIEKLLSQDSDVLIFDEPTASFSKEDLNTFYDLLHHMKDQGKTIVYITRSIAEALEISDQISMSKT